MSEAIDKYKFPVKYDADIQAIVDSEGLDLTEVGDIFHWSDADSIGEYIAQAINEKHERESNDQPT